MAPGLFRTMYVEAGACVDDSDSQDQASSFVRCALEETACLGDIFVTSFDIRQQGHPQLAHCLEKTPQTHISECQNGDSFSCTSESYNCPEGATSDVCTVASNIRDGSKTIYGSCGFSATGDLCVWSPVSCPADNSYNATAHRCECENVHTGACFVDNEFEQYLYCAVSPKACVDSYSYVPIPELHSHYNTHCMLCSSTSTATNAAPLQDHSPAIPKSQWNRADRLLLLLAGSVLVVVVAIGVVVRRVRQRRATPRGDGVFVVELTEVKPKPTNSIP